MKRSLLVLLMAVAVVAATPAPASGADVPVTGAGPFVSNNGPAITLDAPNGVDVNFSDNLFDPNQVRLNTSAGIVEFRSQGRTNATITADNISDSSWTNVTGLKVSSNNLTVDAENMAHFRVGGDADHVAVRDSLAADDNTADFRYGGSSGSTTLTLTHAPASTQLGAVDADTGTVLDVAMSNASGGITFDMPNSDHTVELQTNDGPPTVDNVSASPQNNETVRYEDQKLAIDVDDPDFPDDTVEVDFYVNNSFVDNTTLNDAGDANISASGLSEGTHTWYVEATDSFGETTTSDTFEFTVDHYDPLVDNASASPQGNPTIRYDNETLELNVSDRDFAEDGDELTVDFTVNGSSVGSDTLQSNGTASVQVGNLDEGTHTWNATVSDDYGQSETSDTFAFTVDHYDTTFSNPSPTGLIDYNPDKLEVDLNDRDFAKDGDSLTVIVDHDGTQVHSETLNSNGTVTATISDPPGGPHTWTVEVTDQYGQTFSQSYDYSTPANITIYNETSPSQKINTATVEVEFFGSEDTVVERSTTNGVINLTGLPVDEEFVVVAKTNGYVDRRIYLDTIYEQDEVYLLSESITRNDLVFTLDDETGNFPSGDTVLRVEKSMTKDFDGDNSDETRWQTIAGDTFGASGDFPVILESDTRYQLRVTGPDNRERVLGHYTVSGDAAETLTIGELVFESDVSADEAVFNSQMVQFNDTRYIKLAYRDPAAATDELDVVIHRTNNESKEILNRTFKGDYGEFGTTVIVPASAQDNVSYQIKYDANRTGDYQDESGEQSVGSVPQVGEDLPIDDTVLAYLSYVLIVAVMGLVVIYDDSLAALAGTVTAAGLAILGTIAIHPIALGIAGSISVVYATARR